MQRAGNILGNTDQRLGKVKKIRDRWNDIAGEVLAAQTTPVSIRGGTLRVLCESPAWIQQIDILSTSLLPRIKTMTGVRLKGIKGKFGVSRPISPGRKAPPKTIIPQLHSVDIERVRDPAIKEALKDLLDLKGTNTDG